jgi:hypothetical protein
MVNVYEVAGRDLEYIVADDGLGITDFNVDAAPFEDLDGELDDFEVEDLVPSRKELPPSGDLSPPGKPEEYVINVLERGGEELKWGKTYDRYLVDALTDGPQR